MATIKVIDKAIQLHLQDNWPSCRIDLHIICMVFASFRNHIFFCRMQQDYFVVMSLLLFLLCQILLTSATSIDSTVGNSISSAAAEHSGQHVSLYTNPGKDAPEKNKYGETTADTGIFDGADDNAFDENGLVIESKAKATTDEDVPPQGEESVKYFCEHVDSCGLRPFLLRGPATVDSLNNGKTCYCNGPKVLNLQGDCYKGVCYDAMHASPRSDGEQDKQGLCQYTVANIVSPTKCNNKFRESLDPNLKHFGQNSAETWIPHKH